MFAQHVRRSVRALRLLKPPRADFVARTHSDFCLIPMNTPTPSVGAYIAACQRVLERYAKQDGFKYEVRPLWLACAT